VRGAVDVVELEAWRGWECRLRDRSIMNKAMKFLDLALDLHVLPRLIFAKSARSFLQFIAPRNLRTTLNTELVLYTLDLHITIELSTRRSRCQDLELVTGK
jgi:hypothetical protein